MRLTQTAIALALALTAAGVGQAETEAPAPVVQEDAGAYLAARIALTDGRHREAAYWFDRALKADPANAALLDGAVISAMSLGDFETAARHALEIRKLGGKSQMATFALVTEAAKRKNAAAIQENLGDGHSIGALFDGLMRAWSDAADGRMTEAVTALDEIAAKPGMEIFGHYHKALALAAVGDFEGADKALAGEDAQGTRLLRRAVFAHVEILSQLERNKDALALLDTVFVRDQDPTVEGLRARLENGETLPWTIVQTPEQGMAEVYYSLATALRGEADSSYTLLYSRAAAYLRPDHTEALLTTATLLNSTGQTDLAQEVYAQVSTEAPEHYLAEIGRAEALYAAGKTDAALEVMQTLSRSYPQLRNVHVTYGDMLRREELYDQAAAAYSDAINLIDKPERNDWMVFFSRGICHERQKRWDEAEADMRKSLELSPDQPQVLNYLGYSFLEWNRNLDEALSLIEKAVAVQPDNGAIVDSLAWAYFRMGRYQDALEPMERASLMEPVDPVVTDHLGDVYWAVGRKLEAEFQWRRALSYGPEEKDAARIRKKLEVGLDKVLADEGAAPLEKIDAAANDN